MRGDMPMMAYMANQTLTPEAAARLSLLQSAPLDKWIALTNDEKQIIAEGETFAEVATAVEEMGAHDPLILRVPEDWTPRVL
jgi:S-methylmethionine-dependent homocysteine/selenocysteine methylase